MYLQYMYVMFSIKYTVKKGNNTYCETCLIQHALGEKFCVGTKRELDYTV